MLAFNYLNFFVTTPYLKVRTDRTANVYSFVQQIYAQPSISKISSLSPRYLLERDQRIHHMQPICEIHVQANCGTHCLMHLVHHRNPPATHNRSFLIDPVQRQGNFCLKKSVSQWDSSARTFLPLTFSSEPFKHVSASDSYNV